MSNHGTVGRMGPSARWLLVRSSRSPPSVAGLRGSRGRKSRATSHAMTGKSWKWRCAGGDKLLVGRCPGGRETCWYYVASVGLSLPEEEIPDRERDIRKHGRRGSEIYNICRAERVPVTSLGSEDTTMKERRDVTRSLFGLGSPLLVGT